MLIIKNNIKIAVVQVGLYFEQHDSISSFFQDFHSFLKSNPDIDMVAFSENNVFTYKRNLIGIYTKNCWIL